MGSIGASESVCVVVADFHFRALWFYRAYTLPYASTSPLSIHHDCSMSETAVQLTQGIFTAHQAIKSHLILLQSSPQQRFSVCVCVEMEKAMKCYWGLKCIVPSVTLV